MTNHIPYLDLKFFDKSNVCLIRFNSNQLIFIINLRTTNADFLAERVHDKHPIA